MQLITSDYTMDDPAGVVDGYAYYDLGDSGIYANGGSVGDIENSGAFDGNGYGEGSMHARGNGDGFGH